MTPYGVGAEQDPLPVCAVVWGEDGRICGYVYGRSLATVHAIVEAHPTAVRAVLDGEEWGRPALAAAWRKIDVCRVENCRRILGAPRDRDGFCSLCLDGGARL